MNYLKTRTTFSLRKSVIKPPELIEFAKKQGCSSLAITELGNIYSMVKFYTGCTKVGIKPIIGCDMYISDNDILSNLTILCKNYKAYSDLLKVIATSNSKENFNVLKEVPTLKLGHLADLCSRNFIVYSGSLNSTLSRAIATNYNDFVCSKTYEEAKSLVSPDWKQLFDKEIALYQEIFGKENFFLEVQDVENDSIPAADILSKIVKHASKRLNIPAIATCKPHYLRPENAVDHQILVCVEKKATFNNIGEILERNKDPEYDCFFRNQSSYLLSTEEMTKLYPKEYLDNNERVASLCEPFNILNSPKIPQFQCPNGQNSAEYLSKLCLENWSSVVNESEDKVYQDRLNYELGVLNEVGLSPYFLVVHDIFKWAQSNGWLACARGSAGGSLVAYLLNLSESDPIKYNLVFERFYNAGRNQPGKISLPDIDGDFPVLHREEVREYIRNKYGRTKVASIATFGSLKGASSLKETLRIKSVCSVEETNQLTKFIIDEHKISDELEELRKNGEEASIIGWSLENDPRLKQYAYYDDNGILQGEYAPHFEQAIRLENCKRNLSTHACGLVVSSQTLSEFCPMVYNKNSDDLMCGLEMNDVEAVGCMKLDILGVCSLDDITETIRLVNEGDLNGR